MNKKLYVLIQCAIETTLNEHCEEDLWGEYLHPTLVDEMTAASAAVFDAAMNGQKFLRKERE